ncbi:MAG: tetratricopeptide repeat protein [Panacagrimonas sp.]
MNLKICICCAALVLSACASSTGRRESGWPYPQTPAPSAPPAAPVPATPPPAAPGTAPAPSAPVPIEQPLPAMQNFPKTADQISAQAVLSLMRQSDEARAQGHLDLAAANLERAQRIEPRNYFVWSALARVYLEQEQYDQAVAVASRANALARGNVYVEVENWKIIGAARQAQGDSVGALQAQSRVEEIERELAAAGGG